MHIYKILVWLFFSYFDQVAITAIPFHSKLMMSGEGAGKVEEGGSLLSLSDISIICEINP